MNDEEKIALVREGVDAWNSRDWGRMEKSFWPDALMVAPKGWPEVSDSHGWPEIQRQFERLKESWADDRAEDIELEAVGETVLLGFNWIVTGEASGVPVETAMYGVYWFRDTAIARVQFFRDRDEALAAAGDGDGAE